MRVEFADQYNCCCLVLQFPGRPPELCTEDAAWRSLKGNAI
jgi:hypothetical protein